MEARVHSFDDVNPNLIRSRFLALVPNDNITDVQISTKVVGTVPLRRQLSHSDVATAVATTVSGRFPYAGDPPEHLMGLSSYFNMSFASTSLGFSKCVLNEAVICPAGKRHDPLLLLTTSLDQCLGCQSECAGFQPAPLAAAC